MYNGLCANIMGINVSDIIAFISLMMSIWAMYKANKAQKQQEFINDKEIERYKKADIKIHSIKKDKGGYNVFFTNINEAPAYNIRVDWQGYDKEETVNIVDYGKLPFPILNKDECFYIYIGLYMGSNKNHIITVLWDDNRKDNKKDVVISF